MTRRVFCLVVLLAGSTSLSHGQIQTVQAPGTTVTTVDGRQVTVAGDFSQEELALKLREIEAAAAGIALPSPTSGINSRSTTRTGTSRITGRIVNSNGTPVRQATVRGNVLQVAGFTSLRTTTSDQDGRYELRDLPAGSYTVTAQKSNFVALSYGQVQVSDIPKRVTVGENQVVDRIDIALPRGGVIAGRVLDEFGEPLSDIQVRIVRRTQSQGQMRAAATGPSAVTNDIGEYRLFGLQPGQSYLSVTPRPPSPVETDGSRNGYAATYYPGTPVFANATAITVGVNETVAGMDFPLTAARLATISGIALDSQGTPVRAGNVTAADRNGNLATASGGPIRDGNFVLPLLPPGEYFLRVSLPPPPPPPLPPGTPMPVAAEKLRAIMQTLPPADTLVANVMVNGSDVTGVVMMPLRRVNVSGRVVFDTPGAPGAKLPPPAAFRLSVAPRSPEASVGGGAPNVTDDFTFQVSVPAAELALRATIGGPDWVLKSIRMNGVDITDAGVDLRNSADVSVDIEFTNRPPEVSGVAFDAQGEPAGEYAVFLFPQEREKWILDSRLVVMANSDADGRYKVRTLPPGRYYAALINRLQIGIIQDSDFEALTTRATPFTLAAGEKKTLDLRAR